LNNRSNDIIDVEPDQRAENLKAVGWVSYILHLIVAVAAVVPSAQPSIALLLVALIIDLVKRSDADGTWQASHFSWRIRSVIWAGVLYVLTSPLWLAFLLPGMIAWGLISLWFLYRIIRGMLSMSKGQAVDA
jgi:Predicted membrane protein